MALTSQERKALAGMAVITAFVAGAVYVIGRRNFWFEAKNTYHTQVVDADGLRVGSVVSISGYRVGEVTGLDVMDDNRIAVTVEVKRSVEARIREGSSANVFRAFIIGEKKIDIVPGPADGKILPSGAELPGKEATDLSEFLSGRKLTDIMNQVEGLLTGVTSALKDANEVFGKYKSGEMNQVIGMVPPALTNFIKLSDDLLTMTKELKKKNKELPKFVDSGADVLTRIKTDFLANDLAANTLRGVNTTLATANGVLLPLAQRQKLIEHLLDNLGDLSRDLKKNPEFTRDLLEAVNELTVTLKALQKTWFLEDQSVDARKALKKSHGKPAPKAKAKAPAPNDDGSASGD